MPNVQRRGFGKIDFFKFSAEMKLVDRAVKETKDFLGAAAWRAASPI
jgi:hypothetical protein